MLLLVWAGQVTASSGDLRLIDAVRHQDRDAVRLLLQGQESVDVNATQPDGAAAVHWAAHWGDLDTLDLLIQAGAAVDVSNVHGVTPLGLACENHDSKIVARLLENGADPNAAQSNGETALMTCSKTGAIEAVEGLLAAGADMNAAEDWNDQTALMWAAGQHHPGVTKLLLEAGAAVGARTKVKRQLVNTGGTTQGNPSTTRLADIGGFTPLLFSARRGDIESARLILEAGADVNEVDAYGSTALVIAAHSDQGDLARFLLEEGADPNAADGGYAPLHAAVLSGDEELVEALLAKGADPNATVTQGTPMPRASQQLLLSSKVVGATPFFLAAKYAATDLMRILAAAGGDPLVGLSNGTTPLMAAAGSQWFAVTEDRRERALVPEVLNVIRGNELPTLEAVKVAVETGADVNATDERGRTALHAVASLGFSGVARFLADSGAVLDVKDEKGVTPLAVATAPTAPASAQLVAELLVELGAEE